MPTAVLSMLVFMDVAELMTFLAGRLAVISADVDLSMALMGAW